MTVGSRSFPAIELHIDPQAEVPGATSPAELWAGALGSVFLWMVGRELWKEHVRAGELTAYLSIHFSDRPAAGEDSRETAAGSEEADKVVSALNVELRGRMPDMNDAGFAEVAETAMKRCSEMLAIRADQLAISVKAVLDGVR